MFDRLTLAARRLIDSANRDGIRRGHDALGTGHLLLAILFDPEWSGRALKVLEVEPDRLREEVTRLQPDVLPGPDPGLLPWTPRAKGALDVASRFAGKWIGVGDILCGLLAEPPHGV